LWEAARIKTLWRGISEAEAVLAILLVSAWLTKIIVVALW
jgi:hypothetical protein